MKAVSKPMKILAISIFLLCCTSQLHAENSRLLPSLEEQLADEVVEDDTTNTGTTAQEPIEAQGDAAKGDAEEPAVFTGDTANVLIGPDGVKPKRVVISPGATVVWKNTSKSAVQVNFIGKAISTTCKAPRGFAIGGKGVYSSSPIPPNGIASLCFLEPELYVYEVRNPRGGEDVKVRDGVAGAIQVLKP